MENFLLAKWMGMDFSFLDSPTQWFGLVIFTLVYSCRLKKQWKFDKKLLVDLLTHVEPPLGCDCSLFSASWLGSLLSFFSLPHNVVRHYIRRRICHKSGERLAFSASAKSSTFPPGTYVYTHNICVHVYNHIAWSISVCGFTIFFQDWWIVIWQTDRTHSISNAVVGLWFSHTCMSTNPAN